MNLMMKILNNIKRYAVPRYVLGNVNTFYKRDLL